jgi:hypothetical protein
VRTGPREGEKRDGVGTTQWVRTAGGEKTIRFGRNTLQIAIFWYFIVLPPYRLPETYDVWVRREG